MIFIILRCKLLSHFWWNFKVPQHIRKNVVQKWKKTLLNLYSSHYCMEIPKLVNPDFGYPTPSLIVAERVPPSVLWRNGFEGSWTRLSTFFLSNFCHYVFDDFSKWSAHVCSSKLWKILKYAKKYGKQWRKALFNLPIKPIFWLIPDKPKIRFQVPDPSLANKCTKVQKRL